MPRRDKLNKNEKLTLVIASLALGLTIIQLIFSIPFVADFFYSAEVVGERVEDKYSNGEYESTFLIKNVGNKMADNLVVNLTIPVKSKITVLPNVLYEVDFRKNGEPLKDVVIKCAHFLPNENIHVIVNTDSLDYFKFNVGPDTLAVPMLGVIKHDEGFGKINKQ